MVLTWGKHPEDLDLHAVEAELSTQEKICEVYYASKHCDNFELDVDNQHVS